MSTNENADLRTGHPQWRYGIVRLVSPRYEFVDIDHIDEALEYVF